MVRQFVQKSFNLFLFIVLHLPIRFALSVLKLTENLCILIFLIVQYF